MTRSSRSSERTDCSGTASMSRTSGGTFSRLCSNCRCGRLWWRSSVHTGTCPSSPCKTNPAWRGLFCCFLLHYGKFMMPRKKKKEGKTPPCNGDGSNLRRSDFTRAHVILRRVRNWCFFCLFFLRIMEIIFFKGKRSEVSPSVHLNSECLLV